MTLSIRILLFRRVFHGLRDDGQPDWPPAPTRLLGALISGAHSLRDPAKTAAARAAIRKLAESPAPTIDLPKSHHLDLPGTYTENTWHPDKVTAKTLGSYLDTSQLRLSTKSRSLKPQDAMALAHDEIDYHVDLKLTSSEFSALQEAAAVIPYFGRSQDTCEIYLEESTTVPELTHPHSIRLYPYLRSGGTTRGWIPATVDWYDLNFERVFGENPLINQLPPLPATSYIQPLSYLPFQVTAPQGTVIPLEKSLPNYFIPQVMRFLQDSIAEPSRECCLIPLTQSQLPWGDGRLVGIGVFPMTDHAEGLQPPADLELVAQDVDKRLMEFNDEEHELARVRTSGALQPGHWNFESRRWVSTTPLRAFPDPRVLGAQLERAISERFDAQIINLTLRKHPLHRHEQRWSEVEFTDGFGQWWVELETDIPITGPLQLGSGIESGFGVLRPVGAKQ